MKKYIFILILLLMSIFIAPFSVQVFAEENETPETFNTYYPENVLEYTNLNNISNVSANDNFIAYTISNNKLVIINKETKEKNEFIFNNIQKIKFLNNNNLIILDDGHFKNISTISNNITNISQLYNLDQTIFLKEVCDIFTNEDNLYIGYVKEKHFELHTFDILDSEESLLKNHQIKTLTTTNDFSNATMLAINSSSAHVYIDNSHTASPDDKYIICKINFTTNSEIVKDFKAYAQLLDSFIINNEEYVLTFTQESLYLIKYSNEDYIDTIQVSIGTNTSTNSTITNILTNTKTSTNFPLFDLSGFDVYNNTIYVCDENYNSIAAYNITYSEDSINLQSDKVLISSSSSNIGRFNNVDNISFFSDEIITSDKDNHRIQIFNNNTPTITKLSDTDLPRSVVSDKYNNLYFITGNNDNSIINKYCLINNEYKLKSKFTHINSMQIGYISDLVIDNNSTLYGLDTTSNKLIAITDSNISIVASLPDISESSKLEYLNEHGNLALLNNNSIMILNLTDISLSKQTTIQCNDITSGLNYLYAINDTTITLIDCSTGTPVVTENVYQNNNLANISSITLDIKNNKFWGFNKERQCLINFDNTLNEKEFILNDFTENVNLTTSDDLVAFITNKDNAIYEYPYNIGTKFTNLPNGTKCIGIEKYSSDFYRVLFNYNNSLQSGFVNAKDVDKQKITEEQIDVIVTNQKIPVYKYPTLLKHNSKEIIVNYLNINTCIKLEYLFPISIDGKDFYLYKNGSRIGFIFSADVVADDGIHIKYFENENAQINSFDEDKIIVYEEDLQTQITTISNKYRIYIENYDKNSKYTKITYKDSKLNTIEGYVETRFVVMDELDNSKIILILIIIVSIILLGVISIFIIISKKKK